MLPFTYHIHKHSFNALLDGGYGTGYVTTAVVPAGPVISPYGGGGGLGLGGLGGLGGLPPKIRAIFIPQGGGGFGASAW